MKIINFLSLIIIFSLLSLFSSKYEHSNLKKFLNKLDLPDIPKNNLLFEDDLPSSNKKFNDINQDDGGSSKVNLKCLWVDKYDIFTLQKLMKKDNDYEIDLPDGSKIYFNFCKNTKQNNDSTVVWKNLLEKLLELLDPLMEIKMMEMNGNVLAKQKVYNWC